MYQDISIALGDSYVMFYHPAWPSDKLVPICTLDQCLQQVNDRMIRLGRDLLSWPAGDQDQAARLLWVNWIYGNLQQEPIRKPILAHREGPNLIVDCGDTRLMALSLLDRAQEVSVIVTDRRLHRDHYQGWTAIHNNQSLLAATGFGPDSTIMFNAVLKDWALDWLEIGDNTTAHHLHDIDQRTRMINRYLQTQPREFVFDHLWAKTPIDWSVYDR